jgi:hypothetical protein
MASAGTRPPAKGTGFSLSYLMPEGQSLQYAYKASSRETSKKDGQPIEMSQNMSLKFTVFSKGNKGGNHLLGITMDSIKVHFKTPWTDLIPNVDALKGKQLEMVLSPNGKELEFMGLDKFIYYLLPDVKYHIGSIFKTFFPDLTTEAVHVGDTWKSADDLIFTTIIDLHFISENLNTVEGIETLAGMKCVKVKTTYNGTVSSSGKVKIKGTMKGNSTWYFAYQKGFLVRSIDNIVIDADREVGDHGKKMEPVKTELKIEADLVKW